MKPVADTRNAITHTAKKNFKPQIERHRRERMNRSLDNLRTILMQEQHLPGLFGSRQEKAEILEYAVQFIKMKVSERAERERGHFQGGFSACLHKAAEFLRTESEQPRADKTTSTALSHQLSSYTASAPSLNSHKPRVPSVHHFCVARDALIPQHGGQLIGHKLMSPQIPTVDHHQSSSSAQINPMWRPWP